MFGLPSKKRGALSGFTLLEVSLAVLVVGILISVAVPDLRRCLGRYRLQTAADQLAGEIRETSQLALNEESSFYSIKFYPSPGNAYYVKKSANPGPRVVKAVRLPSGVVLENTNFSDHELRFSARGTPTVGGTVTLRDGVSGSFKYVIVAAVTGRVRVSDQAPKKVEDI